MKGSGFDDGIPTCLLNNVGEWLPSLFEWNPDKENICKKCKILVLLQCFLKNDNAFW